MINSHYGIPINTQSVISVSLDGIVDVMHACIVPGLCRADCDYPGRRVPLDRMWMTVFRETLTWEEAFCRVSSDNQEKLGFPEAIN